MLSLPPETIQQNAETVRQRIESACRRSGRSPEEIRTIPVTKTVDASAVRALADLGFDTFGENRVQPSEPKIAELSDLGLHWHFIGHLQSRKTARVMDLFECVQSVDSIRLAERISRTADEKGAAFPVMIEVNVAGEKQKYGFTPEQLTRSAEALQEFDGLDIRGLMTMAPFTDDDVVLRKTFSGLRDLRDELSGLFVGAGTGELSMGMTNDFEYAIEEGATLLRIGSAFFRE